MRSLRLYDAVFVGGGGHLDPSEREIGIVLGESAGIDGNRYLAVYLIDEEETNMIKENELEFANYAIEKADFYKLANLSVVAVNVKNVICGEEN